MRSGTEVAREIQPTDCSRAREQDKFRPSHHCCNLFHFSQREKVVFTSSKLHIKSSFSSRKTVEKKFILTNKFFFVTSIQFIACALRANLSNWSTGVQRPRDICTGFGRYLYFTKCSWIIMTVLSVSTTLFSLALYIDRCKHVHF